MRGRRIRGPGERECWYHCISRVVAGERLLGEEEKEVLRGMLWQVAEFSGLRILTYAVMSNHFHVLVRVPAQTRVDDAELVRRYEVLYGRSRRAGQPTPEVLEGQLLEDGTEGQQWRARLQARMGNVSAFMQTVNMRFAVWYNRTHRRFGTLWAERFKSVLIEGAEHSLATVAAYIDLNAVRAGLVDDPAHYRWCGYGEAMGGRIPARAGLALVFGDEAGSDNWRMIASRYRTRLFGKGAHGRLEKGKIRSKRALEVIRAGGRVTPVEALRCRVRYFTDGAVLGSKSFVRAWLETNRRTNCPRQVDEPRPLRGADWEDLAVYRRLRAEVFG
jgi:putative transposase